MLKCEVEGHEKWKMRITSNFEYLNYLNRDIQDNLPTPVNKKDEMTKKEKQ